MRALHFCLVAVAFLLSLVTAFDLKGQIDLKLTLDYPSTEASSGKVPSTDRVVYNSRLRFPNGFGGWKQVMDVLDGATREDKLKHLAGIARDAYWQMTQSDSYTGQVRRKRPTALAAMAIGDEIYLSSSLKGGAFAYLPQNDGNPLRKYLIECQLQYPVQGDERQHRTGAACGEPLAAMAFFEMHHDIGQLEGAIFVTVTWGKKKTQLLTYDDIDIIPACNNLWGDPENSGSSWGCEQLLVSLKAEEVPKALGMTSSKLPDDTETTHVHLQCKPAVPVTEGSLSETST